MPLTPTIVAAAPLSDAEYIALVKKILNPDAASGRLGRITSAYYRAFPAISGATTLYVVWNIVSDPTISDSEKKARLVTHYSDVLTSIVGVAAPGFSPSTPDGWRRQFGLKPATVEPVSDVPQSPGVLYVDPPGKLHTFEPAVIG